MVARLQRQPKNRSFRRMWNCRNFGRTSSFYSIQFYSIHARSTWSSTAHLAGRRRTCFLQLSTCYLTPRSRSIHRVWYRFSRRKSTILIGPLWNRQTIQLTCSFYFCGKRRFRNIWSYFCSGWSWSRTYIVYLRLIVHYSSINGCNLFRLYKGSYLTYETTRLQRAKNRSKSYSGDSSSGHCRIGRTLLACLT